MAELLLHSSSQLLIDTYLKRPSHGLLLSGIRGVGLMTIARQLARGIDAQSVIREVAPNEQGTIAIETIRGLYQLTRTHREKALVVIIDDAESMGREAQNALLKLLEEPAGQVYFILTSHHSQLLLPTIVSRTQKIEVLPVGVHASRRVLAVSTDASRHAQLMFLAAGLPAELVRLQADEAYFVRRCELVKSARKFLEGDTYERLVLAKTYGSERPVALELLDTLSQLLLFTLFMRQDSALVGSLEHVDATADRLRQNAHIKTQLMYLVTRL